MLEITNWHGYKISDTEGEIVIVGTGFGSVPGILEAVIAGTGRIHPTITEWSDTFIRARVAPDVTVVLATVQIIDGRGKPSKKAKTPPAHPASTSTSAPSWTVTDIAASDDQIRIEGSGLAAVSTAYLFDDNQPSSVFLDLPVSDGGDLIVDWPATFTGNIERLRLVSEDLAEVEQIEGPWSMTALPNINSVSAVLRGGPRAGLDIFGIGFGTVEGVVLARQVGGALQRMQVLSNSWTDSTISASAVGAQTYDRVEVHTEAGVAVWTGEVTTPYDGITPIEFWNVTPLAPQVPGNGRVRIDGTGLDSIGYIYLDYGVGSPSAAQNLYHPTNFPNGAAENAGLGSVGVIWTDDVIEFEHPVFDGQTLFDIFGWLIDQNGFVIGQAAYLDFVDFTF